MLLENASASSTDAAGTVVRQPLDFAVSLQRTGDAVPDDLKRIVVRKWRSEVSKTNYALARLCKANEKGLRRNAR